MRHLRASAIALALLSPIACSSSSGSSDNGENDILGINLKVPPAWDANVTRPSSEADALAARQQCRFKKGAMPAETVGQELPMDKNIPIKNIVVLMQENRSFDSYFGHLQRYAEAKGGPLRQGTDDAGNTPDRAIEAADEGTQIPKRIDSPDGEKVAWQRAAMMCASDTNHEWAGSHVEWNEGKMNGFFQANQGFFEKGEPTPTDATVAFAGERSMWWYDEQEIPFYYDLASTFAIGDHYHSSLIGPTYPNRDYLYAASSNGVVDGTYAGANIGAFKFTSADNDVLIFDELTRRGISWKIYVNNPNGELVPRVFAYLGGAKGAERVLAWHQAKILNQNPLNVLPIVNMTQFEIDAAAGILPQVAFVDGDIRETVHGTDEHPPSDIQNGEQFASKIIGALMKSSQWKDSVLFHVYDEHGGTYDHVAPPDACPPDDVAPILNGADDPGFAVDSNGQKLGFDKLGFRVPVVVVSPYAKRHYVSHKTYDHTSITRFIEAKFKLPALTSRDANANPMFDFFDFDHPDTSVPVLADAPVDADAYSACEQFFSGPDLTDDSGLPHPQ